MTQAMRDQLIAGCANLAGGQSVAELAEARDRCLVGIHRALAEARRT